MIIALGSEHGGLFSNDDKLAEQLLAAGLASGDKLWRFPLADAYDKLLDSQIPAMQNVGPRAAGSITPAPFPTRLVADGGRWGPHSIPCVVLTGTRGRPHIQDTTTSGGR